MSHVATEPNPGTPSYRDPAGAQVFVTRADLKALEASLMTHITELKAQTAGLKDTFAGPQNITGSKTGSFSGTVTYNGDVTTTGTIAALANLISALQRAGIVIDLTT